MAPLYEDKRLFGNVWKSRCEKMFSSSAVLPGPSCPPHSLPPSTSSNHSAAAVKRRSEGQPPACVAKQSFPICKMEIWHLGNELCLKLLQCQVFMIKRAASPCTQRCVGLQRRTSASAETAQSRLICSKNTLLSSTDSGLLHTRSLFSILFHSCQPVWSRLKLLHQHFCLNSTFKRYRTFTDI